MPKDESLGIAAVIAVMLVIATHDLHTWKTHGRSLRGFRAWSHLHLAE